MDTEIRNDRLLDTKQLGEFLGVSPGAIRTGLCRGEFPLQPIRLGSRLRWRESTVLRWLEDQEAKAGR